MWERSWAVAFSLVVLVGCSDKSDGAQAAPGAGNVAGSPGNSAAGMSGENAGETNSAGATNSAGNTSSAGASSTSEFSCSSPPAGCGGDVVGTWQIEQSCIATLMGVASCAGLIADGTGLTQTGSMTFGADMTYSSTSTTSGTLKTVYPTECTAGLSCTDLATALSAGLPAGYSAPDCTTVASGCSCTFQVSGQTTADSGTYTLSGNTLTQKRTNGGSLAIDYCVRDRALTMVAQNPGTSTQAQTVLLEKQ